MPREPSGDKLVIQSERQDLLSLNTDLEAVDAPRELCGQRGEVRGRGAGSKARVGLIRSASFLGCFVSTFCLKRGTSEKYVQKSKLGPQRWAWRVVALPRTTGRRRVIGSGRFNIYLRSIYRPSDTTSKLPEAQKREDPVSGRRASRRKGALIFHGRTMGALIFHGRRNGKSQRQGSSVCKDAHQASPPGRAGAWGAGSGGAQLRASDGRPVWPQHRLRRAVAGLLLQDGNWRVSGVDMCPPGNMR